MASSIPPWGWWPLGFVGLALWVELLAESSARTRAQYSFLVGILWLAPTTLWMIDLTAPGWPVAVVIYSALFAVVGAITPSDRRRFAAFPAAITLAELVRGAVPFGGVPLATLAMAQVSSPLGPTARIFGSLLLTALSALVGVAIAAAFARDRRVLVAAVGLALGATVAAPLAPGADTVDEIAVAVVQGGGPQNTRADVCANRAVFERHIAATDLVQLPVDLVLWPEDVVHPSGDTAVTPARCDDPLLTQTEVHERLATLATELDALLIPGFFEQSADGLANVNYSIVFTPNGDVGDRYDKVRRVPFGEFVPLRSLVEQFSGELPARDVRAGTEPAVLETSLGPLGVSISWEVFFDDRARDAIGNGGRILLNPTNGSSYWLTILQAQQVASSRLRAIETDRWVLQGAPTGFSAIVDPDGTVIERTGVSETRVLHATVELREGTTLAVRWGAWPMLLASLLGVGVARTREVADSIRSRAAT